MVTWDVMKQLWCLKLNPRRQDPTSLGEGCLVIAWLNVYPRLEYIGGKRGINFQEVCSDPRVWGRKDDRAGIKEALQKAECLFLKMNT